VASFVVLKLSTDDRRLSVDSTLPAENKKHDIDKTNNKL